MKVASKSQRRFQCTELTSSRTVGGQYHTLFPILRRDDQEFKRYLRMKQDTFDYILERLKPKLKKNWCYLHNRSILEEEQLVITLR